MRALNVVASCRRRGSGVRVTARWFPLLVAYSVALCPAPAVPDAQAAPAPSMTVQPDEAMENTVGLPDALPLAEAVARFNERTKRLSGEPNGSTQRPLTDEEVLTALCYRLALGTDLAKAGREAYERIVSTRMLPKGAHLDFVRGWVGARPLGRGTKPMDIKVWQITLDVWMDRHPLTPDSRSPASRLLIRLEHLGTTPSSLVAPDGNEP